MDDECESHNVEASKTRPFCQPPAVIASSLENDECGRREFDLDSLAWPGCSIPERVWPRETNLA